MAWLARNNFTAGEAMSHAFLNNLANDIRAWGGDINGGGYSLANAKLAMPAGTVSVPSVAAGADLDTGLFWPSSNVLGVTAGGVSILRLGQEALFSPYNVISVLRIEPAAANAGIVINSGVAGPGYIYRVLNWSYGGTDFKISRFHSDAGGASSPIDDLVVLSDGKVGIAKGNPGTQLAVAGLPPYADNAAALGAGLTAGDFYRTAAGLVGVVF